VSVPPALNLGILGLAAAVLAATAILLALFGFERTVALRYLRRSKPFAALRWGLFASLLPMAAGAALLGLGRGLWQAEALGAVLFFAGAVAGFAVLTMRLFSLFTTIATLGLALGVAALIVVLAVTSGFQRDFLERVSSFHAHLVVSIYGEPTLKQAHPEMRELMGKLREVPGAVAVAPFVVSFAEVLIGQTGAYLKAIDLSQGPPPVARWMTAGKLEDLDRPAHCPGVLPDDGPSPPVGRMLMGSELARQVKAKVGSCISVMVPFSRTGGLESASMRFQVVGLFQMGFHLHDTRLAYISLADVPHIEGNRPFLYGVEVYLDDPMQAPALVPGLEERLNREYGVLDWRFQSKGLFDSLSAQRVVIGLFLVLIILVSAFNLIGSLTILVLRKRREIAVLGALGARPRSLLRIFVLAGAMAGVLGVGGGLALGLLLCGVLSVYHFPLDVSVYKIAELPVNVQLEDVLLVCGIGQLACLLATLPPVRRASGQRVVEGLRPV
jgi:lipoprotein-releasing system permease protein